jgi:hypothetical protein
MTTASPLWEPIAEAVAWLNAHNPRTPEESALRILKVTEEAGEVAAAYIGMTGQNSRKGVTHSSGDVARELCDVRHLDRLRSRFTQNGASS